MQPIARFMKRLGAGAAVCALSAGAALAQPVKDINIALVLPLSGPVMVNVDPAVKSIKLALEEVNAKGIMVGGQKYRFNVQWFDEECKPPVAINATRAALAKVQPLHMVWTAYCSSSAVATAAI